MILNSAQLKHKHFGPKLKHIVMLEKSAITIHLYLNDILIMKRNFKQWWSITPANQQSEQLPLTSTC